MQPWLADDRVERQQPVSTEMANDVGHGHAVDVERHHLAGSDPAPAALFVFADRDEPEEQLTRRFPLLSVELFVQIICSSPERAVRPPPIVRNISATRASRPKKIPVSSARKWRSPSYGFDA